MSTSIGIDVGSVAVKVVVLTDGQPTGRLREATSPDVVAQSRALLEKAAGRGAVCATGYGRNLVEEADARVSEIMANAVGVGLLQRHWGELERVFGEPPEPPRLDERVRTIVDVGGQDSKVISFGEDGLVRDFAMNDRCAAGTGRFLEVMARVLEVDLSGLDRLALEASESALISSACTVFAESEVVSLLAEGVPRCRVAAGVFHSVAQQVFALAERCRWRPPVLFDGGPSASLALRRALGRRFGVAPVVPPCGQFATALGAALVAADRRLSDQLTGTGQGL